MTRVNRNEIIRKVSDKMLLIRTEAGYTQDKMAEVIGVSKKTLVQIEKGRIQASWSTVVTVCALFRGTETIQFLFGSEPLEVLETIAHHGVDFRKEKTLGGKVWWREIMSKNGYILQQNMISQHYRILDQEHFRLFSTFNEEEAYAFFQEVTSDKE